MLTHILLRYAPQNIRYTRTTLSEIQLLLFISLKNNINTIRAWLNNSSVASGNTNNNYSRVSVLEDIDLKKLGSLKLFIPDVDKNSNFVTPATNQNTQKTTDQPQVAPQQESVVIESNNLNQNNTSSIQNASTTLTLEQQPQKISLIKRFFLWLSNLFGKLATQ